MTLDVCQGHSSIASFFSILTSASRGPSDDDDDDDDDDIKFQQ